MIAMLRITLHVNATQVADYQVRNVGPVGVDEARCRYEVARIQAGRFAGPTILTLEHARADGAHQLAAAVLARLDQGGDRR